MCCLAQAGSPDNHLSCLSSQGSEAVQALLTHPGLPSAAPLPSARRVNQAPSKCFFAVLRHSSVAKHPLCRSAGVHSVKALKQCLFSSKEKRSCIPDLGYYTHRISTMDHHASVGWNLNQNCSNAAWWSSACRPLFSCMWAKTCDSCAQSVCCCRSQHHVTLAACDTH